MAIYLDRARITLEVYLQRGIDGIAAARAGDEEKLIELLNGRKAAFNNFRYWDFVSLQYDQEYAARPEFQALWVKISGVNQELSEYLEAEHQSLHRDLVVSRGVRSKLSKFKTKTQIPNGFLHGV
ncbi:MAG: hypothetical protein HRU19_26015 [Pseudobacteriovorax sp.]|nr:hypothetical protein [Pseudobacteriovorax sp.]